MAGVKGRSGGRNSKTAEELKVHGTFNATRHTGIENPDPPEGRPKPPGKLGKIARSEWKRMIRGLSEARILSTVDAAPLYQYCQLFGETEALVADVQQMNALVEQLKGALKDVNGESLVEALSHIAKLNAQRTKHTTLIRQGRMALRVYLIEFGLTPAARSRVKIVGGTPGKREKREPSPLQKLQAAARQFRVVP